MTYPEFEARWAAAGGAERANYALFLHDLCHLLGVEPPQPTTAQRQHDAYVLERDVTFPDGTHGRIDLYKRGCFVLETKQGTDAQDAAAQRERHDLGLSPERRRRGHALRGTRKWDEMMQQARHQALGYVRALPPQEPRPPFVVVVDVGFCLDLYANFSGTTDAYAPFLDLLSGLPERREQQRHLGANAYRVRLADLADEQVRQRLALLFTQPQELDPSRRAARVTRALAAQLAALSQQLEQAGHASEVVAQFLMRCLFTMFAEDVQLIPQDAFTGLLRQYQQEELRALLPDVLQSLWHSMDLGGFAPALHTRLPRFNGQLFHNATALPLTRAQMELLLQAAEADWREVEPAIFGTLLERALDPHERHRLGAHYTPRRYVERLVLPTVLEPLRREWAAAQAAATRRHDEGNDQQARQELVKFLNRLTSLRILDPACGSGNFLYVTLEHLKRLEGEVLAAINRFGHSQMLDLAGATTVSPQQLLGLELNPRAAAIADVVLRIGYLQWHLRTHGPTQLREPLLDNYQNIRQQDAVLAHDAPTPRLDAHGQPVRRWDGRTTKLHPATGREVPDETAQVPVLDYPNPRPAEWPQADFIVGNPPFLGPARMREALGDGYAEALRQAYKGQVPDSADLVMYWWHKAGQVTAQGPTERFGFITTNSLKQTFNRRVLQPFLDGDNAPLMLDFAIPDHPWIDSGDGAAVRIAMTVAEPRANGQATGQLLMVKSEAVAEGDEAADVSFSQQEGKILADLSIGAELDSAKPLKANESIASPGVKLHGAGFIVSPETAASLGLGVIEGLEKHIRPYRNGRDLTAKPRESMVIDLFGLDDKEVLVRFPNVYQHVVEQVKPERDAKGSSKDGAAYARLWWLFGKPRSEMRKALRGLNRYIATVETAKHRLFQFLNADVLPDNMLIAIALDDAFHLGVLSSRIHETWSLAAGGILGVGATPRYNKSRCFDPFPFPDATPEQQARIRELAETLDAHRKRQQALHPTLTLTDLYNVVEKLRAGHELTAKEKQTNQLGLASVLLSLHQQLDAAVAEAYGWPANLPEAELLQRLVHLNHQRAREEQAGHIRYLRPAYQAPEQVQAHLGLPTPAPEAAAPSGKAPKGKAAKASPAAPALVAAGADTFPQDLAQQMQAVRTLVQQSEAPLTARQVAQQFRRLRPEKVQPLLDTLAALGLLRQTPEGSYAG
ncbi:class I SAM-dependent DNA methyltransferase [Hymenobacter latericus]|uniref:class I SAM-dependent DNA methyltransferase n=1 Tax=Hymenobacter sp. YIM 151858-1 TaxID=2987688 RepID=UPI00222711DA|nr:DNA methyltransferase [Hymenobacter sp. YIM 151858-1]UYZ61055.1 class I SAM-dependent DNA methyltransferase [Hymenobacter sp. YIM 151858-1]